MRFPDSLLAAALLLALGSAAHAQWCDSMINPAAEVTLTHPAVTTFVARTQLTETEVRELAQSGEALTLAEADPRVKPKHLGRADDNVGIRHFLLGDHAAAMSFLPAARETDPNHRLFREAAGEGERAIPFGEEMAKVETRSARIELPSPGHPGPTPAAAPGGTIEERLERPDGLGRKGLVTLGEYDKRRAEILA